MGDTTNWSTTARDTTGRESATDSASAREIPIEGVPGRAPVPEQELRDASLEVGGNQKKTRPHYHLQESRVITGLVEKTPEGAPVPEKTPADKTLRRARAQALAPAPSRDASLEPWR